MSLSLSLGCSLQQNLQLTQKLVISMPQIQWSLLQAYCNGHIGPPPFVPPTFEEEVFTPRLKLEPRTIEGFEALDHVERMKRVDQANAVFHFAYTRGYDSYDGKDKHYFKIPLLRDFSITRGPEGLDGIKIRITRAEYERAQAILEAVGEMERIARAVPYFGLYRSVTKHLKKKYGVGLKDVVLVSVDRGGRLPCIILQHALGLPNMETLKVDQGSRQLDEDKLRAFERLGTLRGRHVLFVDSTVDSGRQIRALERHFEDPAWQDRLGFRSWSVVGSNEDGQSLDHHHNVNWGVDPDSTFEDNPELMGIDYGSSHTKVVEKPTPASKAIRRCLLSVPAGLIYTASDIDDQIESQRREWNKRQKARRAKHRHEVSTAKAEHQKELKAYKKEQARAKLYDKVERECNRITGTQTWSRLSDRTPTVSFAGLPSQIPNGTKHQHRNILVVGHGRQCDLPESAVALVTDSLGPYHSFFAGTPKGNPGKVLETALSRLAQPEVRLYQPGYQEGRVNDSFGGVPVHFAGPNKEEMREKMVRDSHFMLVLGGGRGTLREILLALHLGKPIYLVRGWGPIPAYLERGVRYTKLSHLHFCDDLAEAVQAIMATTQM